MELYQGILLGILQGITEFLPVSSSGHLVLGQHFFNLTEPMLAFDISVHMGTLAAIVIVFFKDIKEIGISVYKAIYAKSDIKFFLLIITGCIPTAIIGFIIQIWEDVIFSSILLVGFMLIVTGCILWLTRHKQKPMKEQSMDISNFSFKSAFFIGVCQGIAVIPGISRSGATISAGLFAGLDRKMAAKFSFLLSIPAIIGAELLQLIGSLNSLGSVNQPVIMTNITLFGTLSSFITGYIALIILLRIVNNGKLHLFAPYCWVAGIAVIIYDLTSLL
ncbi:MAG: undecaprenyl-diphosphate phosphatase [Desulfobacteraceae bacterium]|nr:undecaprenyl-diphosphate phosphatase [Desulfobacteraceae bacterium]